MKPLSTFFMIAGHKQLPSDHDFIKIENLKNLSQAVYDPDGWRQIVLQRNCRIPFHVTLMTAQPAKVR
jgi:hypothetical protein